MRYTNATATYRLIYKDIDCRIATHAKLLTEAVKLFFDLRVHRAVIAEVAIVVIVF